MGLVIVISLDKLIIIQWIEMFIKSVNFGSIKNILERRKLEHNEDSIDLELLAIEVLEFYILFSV